MCIRDRRDDDREERGAVFLTDMGATLTPYVTYSPLATLDRHSQGLHLDIEAIELIDGPGKVHVHRVAAGHPQQQLARLA